MLVYVEDSERRMNIKQKNGNREHTLCTASSLPGPEPEWGVGGLALKVAGAVADY